MHVPSTVRSIHLVSRFHFWFSGFYFWIAGTPGSKKSFLSRFATHSPSGRALLKKKVENVCRPDEKVNYKQGKFNKVDGKRVEEERKSYQETFLLKIPRAFLRKIIGHPRHIIYPSTVSRVRHCADFLRLQASMYFYYSIQYQSKCTPLTPEATIVYSRPQLIVA